MDVNTGSLSGQEENTLSSTPSLQSVSPPFIASDQPIVLADTNPVQTELHYAGFWIRGAAMMIDNAVFVLLSLFVSVLLSMPDLTIPRVAVKFSVLLPFFGFSYIALGVFFIRKYGSTPGKMMAGLAIFPDAGVELTVGRIILREFIGKVVSGIFLCIGYFMVAFTNRKKAAHDMIASTTVVYRNEGRKLFSAIFGILSFVIILGVYFGLLAGSLFSGLSALKEKNSNISVSVSPAIETDENGGLPIKNDEDKSRLGTFEQVQPQPVNKPSDNQANIPTSVSIVESTTGNDFTKDMSITDALQKYVVELKNYKEKTGSYSGFPKLDLHVECTTGRSAATLDIAPNGSSFVLYQHPCINRNLSYCYDETSAALSIVETALIKKTYHCK